MTIIEPYPAIDRLDAVAKVRGEALYGTDRTDERMAFGAFAVAPIVKGSIKEIDVSRARDVHGVVDVLTSEAFRGIESSGFLMSGGFAIQSFQPFLSDEIHYRGQPIALVIADCLEAATEAASLVQAQYATEAFQVSIDKVPAADVLNQAETDLPPPIAKDKVAGDADAVMKEANEIVELRLSSPPQHQNPIELVGTVAEWRDGRLIICEGTQNAGALRAGLAKQLGLDLDDVEVISPYVGGGFGQKNAQQMQTLAVAVAARRLGRPVKLVVPRDQLFHDASFRPASRHRVKLGAGAEGKLIALIHEVDAQTSHHDLFPARYTESSSRLHGIPNFRGHQRLVRTDTQTPGYMRAPFEHMAAFAIETTVDEMATRLRMDPVELRLANDTQVDAIAELPLSSRHMADCLTRGAEMFGWSRRSAQPESMRAEDGTQIGWGVACGAYPASTAPGVARITARVDGKVTLDVTGHEMGQGIRTAVANAVATELKIRADAVVVTMGDTRGAPQHLTAGSWGTATAIPAAILAARALSEKLPGDRGGELVARMRRADLTELSAEGRHLAPGQKDEAFDKLAAGNTFSGGPEYPGFVAFSYSAHFVEVRIEPRTRRVRVPRMVSVVDCGRVVSPRTAESQIRGGVVWGVGACLREVSEVDPRFGGFLNADLAEYIVPVNADIGSIDVALIDKADPRINEPGVKGLGEVALAGVAAAIGNAIYHATGKRLLDLPFRIEDLL